MTASIVFMIKWTFIVFVTVFQECHKMKHEVTYFNIFKTCLKWKHWKYLITRLSAKSKTFPFLPQDTSDNSKVPRFSANHTHLLWRFKRTVKYIVKSLQNKVREVWIYLTSLVSDIHVKRANEVQKEACSTHNKQHKGRGLKHWSHLTVRLSQMFSEIYPLSKIQIQFSVSVATSQCIQLIGD